MTGPPMPSDGPAVRSEKAPTIPRSTSVSTRRYCDGCAPSSDPFFRMKSVSPMPTKAISANSRSGLRPSVNPRDLHVEAINLRFSLNRRKDFFRPISDSPMRRFRSPELMIAIIGGAALVVIGLILLVVLFPLFVPGHLQGSEGGLRVTAAFWSPERRSVVLLVHNGGNLPTYVTRVLVEGVTCDAPGVPTPGSAVLVNVGDEVRLEIPAGSCGIVTGLAKSYKIEVEVSGGKRLEASILVY